MAKSDGGWIQPLPQSCIAILEEFKADGSVVAAVASAYSLYQVTRRDRESQLSAGQASQIVDRITVTTHKLVELLDSLPDGVRVHADVYLHKQTGETFTSQKYRASKQLQLIRDACWYGDLENAEEQSHRAKGGKRDRPDEAKLLADLAAAVQPVTTGVEASYDLAAEIAVTLGYASANDTKDRGKRAREGRGG